MHDEKTIIGRAEKVSFPDLGLKQIPAKVDTGADASSIWASSVALDGTDLVCVFFGSGSSFFTGEKVRFAEGEYTLTRVASSFGHREIRYKVKLSIRIGGKLINATFTLSNRSNKTYPILIGRKLLHGKFLVDVSKGSPLVAAERDKKRQLQSDLEQIQKEGN